MLIVSDQPTIGRLNDPENSGFISKTVRSINVITVNRITPSIAPPIACLVLLAETAHDPATVNIPMQLYDKKSIDDLCHEILKL